MSLLNIWKTTTINLSIVGTLKRGGGLLWRKRCLCTLRVDLISHLNFKVYFKPQIKSTQTTTKAWAMVSNVFMISPRITASYHQVFMMQTWVSNTSFHLFGPSLMTLSPAFSSGLICLATPWCQHTLLSSMTFHVSKSPCLLCSSTFVHRRFCSAGNTLCPLPLAPDSDSLFHTGLSLCFRETWLRECSFSLSRWPRF